MFNMKWASAAVAVYVWGGGEVVLVLVFVLDHLWILGMKGLTLCI